MGDEPEVRVAMEASERVRGGWDHSDSRQKQNKLPDNLLPSGIDVQQATTLTSSGEIDMR